MDLQQQQQQQSMETATPQRNVIKLKLVPAKTTDDNNGHVIANLVVVNEDIDNVNGDIGDDGLLPFIDESTVTATAVSQRQQNGPPLRYYAVGRSTYQVKCPLCQQKANACVMRGCGLKDATCCLSVLSCIYPIFWLCCLFTCCSCQNSGWYSKGLYCSQCGGKLGKLQHRQ